MARNSFKELESYELTGRGKPSPMVEKNLQESVGLISYVGKIFELYIPKIFGLLISFAGGNPDKLNASGRRTPDRADYQDGPRGL